MLKRSKIIAIAMVWIMVLTAFAVMSSAVVADNRADEEALPGWEQGQMIWTRFDDTELDMYVLLRITYTDSQTAGGPYTIETELRMTPSSDASQRKYTVDQVTADEYKVSLLGNGWENGSWATVVTNDGGHPNVNNGDSIETGTYDRTWTSTGTIYYEKKSLGFKRATSSFHDYTDCTPSGQGNAFTLTIDDTVTESTTGGASHDFKPNWDQEPMKVGDQWNQQNQYTLQLDETWEAGGDLTGSGSGSLTQNIYYDYAWQVASKASKTVNNIMGGGNNNFPEAYKITRTGSFDWDQDDGTTQNSGTVTPGPYEHWYAGDGDVFDGGWTVDFNGTSRMIWSTYVAFINSPPELTSPPPSEVDINEDELWEFTNGQDYAVSDPDPGEAGELEYTISAKLGTNTNVLTGLDIDTNGDISYTPSQSDVADDYEITITVTDQYVKDPLSIDVVFTLNIKNSNDAPTANPAIMVDFEMNEGEKKTPSWDLGEVFLDPDMAANPLNANAPYDPAEKMVYSVSNNGSIRLLCANGEDLTAGNQCDAISFEAMDGKFPRDLPVAMTITATDKGGLKANDQITITVKHVNHAPEVNTDADDEFEMDEDTTETINMKDMFTDIDVGDPNYPTSDTLTYDKDGEKNLKITITGSKAKLEPDADWNGEEKVTFEATDKSGAKAEFDLDIIVNPINDAPVVDSVDPTTDPSLDETDDGTEEGDYTKETFSVVASDVDISTGQNDVLTYNWSVEDGDTGDVYDVSTHTADYDFETAFDGDFEDGEFHGGDSSKTYIVTCVVSDGKVDVEAKKWFVTVRNVNRNPLLEGVVVFEVKKDGSETPLTAKSPGNYSLKYGKVYRMDVTDFVTDLDEGIDMGDGVENIDALTFDWSSSIDQVIGSTETITVSAGKASALAEFKLKEGKTHIITVRVTDQDGGSDTFAFTVKTAKSNVGPGFEAVLFVAAIGVAVAVLAYRRRK